MGNKCKFAHIEKPKTEAPPSPRDLSSIPETARKQKNYVVDGPARPPNKERERNQEEEKKKRTTESRKNDFNDDKLQQLKDFVDPEKDLNLENLNNDRMHPVRIVKS